MHIRNDHISIYAGYDPARDVSNCLSLSWGKRLNVRDGELRYEHGITMSWEWLPDLIYYPNTWFSSQTIMARSGGGEWLSSRWTGRRETLHHWSWTFSLEFR